MEFEKALDLACGMMADHTGSCPADICDFDELMNCEEDCRAGCENKCWKIYFLAQARNK